MQQFLGEQTLKLFIFWGVAAFSYALLKWGISRSKKKASLQTVIMPPVHVLLGVFALTTALEMLGGEGTQEFFSLLRRVGIAACLSWCALRGKKVVYCSILMKRAQGKISFDSASLNFLDKLGTLFISLMASFFILHVAGVTILPLITFGGIGAASIAFASKDLFANFFSGLMLHITRPFTVNEQIELPEKKITGRVEEIGWCLTIIRDLHKKPIYLPNSYFSSQAVINISRMTHRRIEEQVRLRCTDAATLTGCVKHVRELLDSHPDVDHELPVHAFVNVLGSSFSEIEIKAYTKKVDYEEFVQVKQDVLLKAHQKLENTFQSFPR